MNLPVQTTTGFQRGGARPPLTSGSTCRGRDRRRRHPRTASARVPARPRRRPRPGACGPSRRRRAESERPERRPPTSAASFAIACRTRRRRRTFRDCRQASARSRPTPSAAARRTRRRASSAAWARPPRACGSPGPTATPRGPPRTRRSWSGADRAGDEVDAAEIDALGKNSAAARRRRRCRGPGLTARIEDRCLLHVPDDESPPVEARHHRSGTGGRRRAAVGKLHPLPGRTLFEHGSFSGRGSPTATTASSANAGPPAPTTSARTTPRRPVTIAGIPTSRA